MRAMLTGDASAPSSWMAPTQSRPMASSRSKASRVSVLNRVANRFRMDSLSGRKFSEVFVNRGAAQGLRTCEGHGQGQRSACLGGHPLRVVDELHVATRRERPGAHPLAVGPNRERASACCASHAYHSSLRMCGMAGWSTPPSLSATGGPPPRLHLQFKAQRGQDCKELIHPHGARVGLQFGHTVLAHTQFCGQHCFWLSLALFRTARSTRPTWLGTERSWFIGSRR